jgi:hypothetical protein
MVVSAAAAEHKVNSKLFKKRRPHTALNRKKNDSLPIEKISSFLRRKMTYYYRHRAGFEPRVLGIGAQRSTTELRCYT